MSDLLEIALGDLLLTLATIQDHLVIDADVVLHVGRVGRVGHQRIHRHAANYRQPPAAHQHPGLVRA
jgi:hypothetical protein